MKKYVLLLFCSLLILTACGKEKDNQEFVKNGFEIDLEQDNQYYMLPTPILARIDGGFYYVNRHYLYFYDNNANQYVYVCSRADCTHNDMDCDAYWESAQEIYYYNGNLYVMGSAGETFENDVIYKADLDGTNREIVVTLEEDVQNGYERTNGMIHRGYYYYSKAVGTDVYQLIQINLETARREVIYEHSKAGAMIGNTSAFGDSLYFYVYDDTQSVGGSLYQYNFKTKILTENLCTEIYSYTFCESGLYLMKEDGIYRYDLEKNTLEQVHETNVKGNLYYDGIYLYHYASNDDYDLNEKGTLTILSEEGVLIDTVKFNCDSIKENTFEGLGFPMLGDDIGFIVLGDNRIWIMDKSDIGGEHHLEELIP